MFIQTALVVSKSKHRYQCYSCNDSEKETRGRERECENVMPTLNQSAEQKCFESRTSRHMNQSQSSSGKFISIQIKPQAENKQPVRSRLQPMRTIISGKRLAFTFELESIPNYLKP